MLVTPVLPLICQVKISAVKNAFLNEFLVFNMNEHHGFFLAGRFSELIRMGEDQPAAHR